MKLSSGPTFFGIQNLPSDRAKHSRSSVSNEVRQARRPIPIVGFDPSTLFKVENEYDH